MTLYRLTDVEAGNSFEESEYKKLIGKYEVVIDGIDLMPHDFKFYQTDGVHPIDSGFERYADNLWKKLHL